jgi:predicted acyl esterase
LPGPRFCQSGIVAARLASSDRLDTDWMVKLEDVYPDCRAMLVIE